MQIDKSLPAFDWHMSVALAGNNIDLAKSLLTLFVEQLENANVNIKTALQNNQHEQLAREIHKLHGGCCYCGVPRLRLIAYDLDSALKHSEKINLENFVQLDEEINTAIHAIKESGILDNKK